MKQLLQNEKVRVALGLIVGLIVIMILNPPHTVCDSKIEIYSELIKKQIKAYQKASTLCKEHTELGGCLQLFEIIGKLNQYLEEVGPQCKEKLEKEKLTGQWLKGSMEIMVRAAWGSVPPANANYKRGWLQPSHVSLFCKLKKNLTTIYGDGDWSGMVNYLLSDLPKAEQLGRSEAWARSLMSDACQF